MIKKLGEYKNRPIVSGNNRNHKSELTEKQLVELLGGNTGGGVTVNNQEKSIEIVENGTTEVVADTGFTGLSKVVVNTNVASSGGGGGSASSVEYLDISGAGDAELIVANYSLLAKVYMEGMYYICTTAFLVLDGFIGIGNAPIAVAIDFNTKIFIGEKMTIKDFIISRGITEDQLAAIPRITEEKFYNTISY